VGDKDHRYVEVIVAATGRKSIEDSLAWLAEDHPMPIDTDWPDLLQALVGLGAGGGEVRKRALRRVTREATSSQIDTGRVLFDADKIPAPSVFGAALGELIARSSDGTLAGLTARGVVRAQHADEHAVETLCHVTGVGYGDAKKWFSPGGTWTEDDVEALLSFLDDLVEGRVEEVAPNTRPARAIELFGGGGWGRIEELRTGGVPYEVLLAQRAVGGSWLLHKNQTSNRPNFVTAGMVCEKLAERQIGYRRATTVGGSDKQKDLQELSGVADKRVGAVVLDSDERPAFGIVFSTANDGGTARANGDGLMRIPLDELPFGLMLSGRGWAQRPETDALARRFGGRVFTERTVDDLIACIEGVLR
jgi:hypothetical protein